MSDLAQRRSGSILSRAARPASSPPATTSKALRTRAVRVNLTGAQTLANKHDALVRFMQAYRETVDWMYSSPDALKIYGEYSSLPPNIVQRVIKLVPKEALQTDEIKDLDGVMADAVAQKFLAAPLTPDQIKELIQIPK